MKVYLRLGWKPKASNVNREATAGIRAGSISPRRVSVAKAPTHIEASHEEGNILAGSLSGSLAALSHAAASGQTIDEPAGDCVLVAAIPSAENAAAVHAALAQFGAPIEGLKPDDLIERGKFFRMGTPPVMVDIMPEIIGVAFDDAWSRRIETLIDSDLGLTAPIISEIDLIAAKLAAGRPQDLADVDAINKAKGDEATRE